MTAAPKNYSKIPMLLKNFKRSIDIYHEEQQIRGGRRRRSGRRRATPTEADMNSRKIDKKRCRRWPIPSRRWGGLVLAWFGLFCLITSSPLAEVAADAPLSLLVALDTSGSMKTNDPRRLLPQAAALMVRLLEEQDRLGLFSFDTAPRLILEGTLSPERRRSCLRDLAGLQPVGAYTNIPAVLDAALETFGPPTASPRALILITDGHVDIDPRQGDTESAVRRLRQEILPAYKEANIPIYTVAFTMQSDQKLLLDMAAQTGGAFLLVERDADLHRAFLWLYEKLKQPQLSPIINNHFLIDPGVEEAMLIASREDPDRPVGLTDPQGRKLSPKDSPGQVRWFATPVFDMVTIPAPRPGVWSLSGCTEGEGKVVLLTDLKLTCPHIPEEIGGDEALAVGAALFEQGRPVTQAELLEQTVFQALLAPEGGEPYRLELKEPPAGQQDWWPPGARVGRFPALRAAGTARVQVQVQGKTFHRERNFCLRVASPWYREALAGAQASGFGRLEFQPGEKGPLDAARGWLSVRPDTGGLAAALFRPAQDGSFSLRLPGPRFLPAVVDVHLTGAVSPGRPVFIQPPSQTISSAMAGGADAVAPGVFLANLRAKLRQLRAQGLPVAGALKSRAGILAALALLAGVLAAVGWLTRRRWRVLLLKGLTTHVFAPGDGAENLMVLAQLEVLQKEKVDLAAKHEELEKRLKHLTADNVDLAKKLEQQSLTFKEKAKVMGELEQKLQEAELEAKAVQQEYTALYARSQGEKQELKKG
jgi:hypothetical protein